MGIRADQESIYLRADTCVYQIFRLFFLNMEYCAFVWSYSHYLTGLSCAMSKTLQMIQQLSAMDASSWPWHCTVPAVQGATSLTGAWVIEKIFYCKKNICDFYIFQARYRNCSYIKGYITDLLDISMCKICMNSRRLLFKSKAKYSVCFTNCCANKMFPNVCRSSSVIKTFSGKLENKLQIRRLNFQKLTKLDQARLLLFDQTNPEKF